MITTCCLICYGRDNGCEVVEHMLLALNALVLSSTSHQDENKKLYRHCRKCWVIDVHWGKRQQVGMNQYDRDPRGLRGFCSWSSNNDSSLYTPSTTGAVFVFAEDGLECNKQLNSRY